MVQLTAETNSKKLHRLINYEEREQLAFLAVQEIKKQPGITTEELAEILKTSEDEMRSILLRHLKAQGKIQNRGWMLPQSAQPESIEDHNFIRSGTNETNKSYSYRNELRIKWESPAGTAKTDGKYPWLCDGDRHLIYIGGGSQSNPIAKARVAQVENWISLNIPPDEIVQRVGMIKLGQWKI